MDPIYPKISIITPSYNQADYLEATIQSVLGQGYPNLEYIIIDGGSTDRSVKIIEKYEEQLTYWISEPDGGMYDAIQKGFEKCTGELMAWINSDDIYHKNSLFTIADIFSAFKDVEWVTGIPSNIDEQGRVIWVGSLEKWSKYRFYAVNPFIIQQESTFWRRSLWDKAGGNINTSLKLASDFELWARFFKHAQLYSFTGLIGGFRVRKNNQKSLEGIDAYMDEANNSLRQHLLSLESEDKIKIHKIIKIHRVLETIPILKHSNFIQKNLNRLLQIPPYIAFDRYQQAFVKKNF